MHRLWRMCTGLPGVSDFCAGRSSREVEAIYGTQRELREGWQVHARRIRQTPSQVAAAAGLGITLLPTSVIKSGRWRDTVRLHEPPPDHARVDTLFIRRRDGFLSATELDPLS